MLWFLIFAQELPEFGLRLDKIREKDEAGFMVEPNLEGLDFDRNR